MESLPGAGRRDAALAVDLDGTLLRTDLLYESAFALLGQRPWMLLLFRSGCCADARR